MFPDAGNNAVVISLQEGPVVNGDVKVMFESSAVSTCGWGKNLDVTQEYLYSGEYFRRNTTNWSLYLGGGEDFKRNTTNGSYY